VGVLLIAPGVNAEGRETLLEAARSAPKIAAIPLLAFSSTLKGLLLEELLARSLLAQFL
jgi:hypothetical protein